MKRADLRRIREQLEDVHLAIVRVEHRLAAASPARVLDDLVTARATLRAVVRRLPDATPNIDRLYHDGPRQQQQQQQVNG